VANGKVHDGNTVSADGVKTLDLLTYIYLLLPSCIFVVTASVRPVFHAAYSAPMNVTCTVCVCFLAARLKKSYKPINELLLSNQWHLAKPGCVTYEA